MLGVYGGLTLVLRARRAATLQQGHYRVAAPAMSSDHWSATDSDFMLEPSHRQWFRYWAATSGGERCRANDMSARRRASGSGPERRVRLSCPGYYRTSTFHGPRCTCGQRPNSSASAGLTARRLIDARCPAGPGGKHQAPESRKDLVHTERSCGLRGPCGPASSAYAVLTARRLTDAGCPAWPGETSGAGAAEGSGLHGT